MKSDIIQKQYSVLSDPLQFKLQPVTNRHKSWIKTSVFTQMFASLQDTETELFKNNITGTVPRKPVIIGSPGISHVRKSRQSSRC